MAEFRGCDEAGEPRHYLAPWIERSINLTGRMDDPLWDLALWSDDFVDILGDSGPKPHFRTRLKMLWGDDGLTIGAELQEPHVWGTQTEHDSVIFQDNDFEVFVDPDGDGHLYGEFEINALNTTWDLLLTQPYHVKGAAISGWEMHGVRTAVSVDGTLNDPRDTDEGWKVEIFTPWPALLEISRESKPPQEGDVWRINFSRVEWEHEVVDGIYRKIAGKPEMNWVWSPMGMVDMHRPHRWGVLEFSKSGASQYSGLPPEQRILDRAYEAQVAYRAATGHWANAVSDLRADLPEGLRIETTSSFLEMTFGNWKIDHLSRFVRA